MGRMLEQPNLCNIDDAPAPLLAAAVCISLAVLTSSPPYQPIAVDKGAVTPPPGASGQNLTMATESAMPYS